MIQLHRDYMLLQTSQGEIIPCSAESVTIELIGDAVKNLDRELIRQAARAVLHYFKEDLGCTTVSVGEFSKALAQALDALGVRIAGTEDEPGTASCDLGVLASGTVELSFFTKLREEMRTGLGQAPRVLRFHNLRGCVKQLVGAKRWNCRCQELNDQIVDYLRACLATEAASCGLVIR
jgi:hypothetical protein